MAKRALVFFLSIALCLLPTRALCCAFGGGPMPLIGLFAAHGEEVQRWAQDASDTLPVLLTVRVAEEIELAFLEIDDPDTIRAYLDALELVQVDTAKPETPWEDAPEKTYAFHLRDESVQSFVFQRGMAFLNPYAPTGFLLETSGLEPLEALDRALLTQREAGFESAVWRKDAVGVQGGDTYFPPGETR